MPDQEIDLLAIIVGEEVGPGQRRAVDTRIEQRAIGEAGVDAKVVKADRDADIGIVGARGRDPSPARTGQRSESAADRAGGLGEDLLDPPDRLVGVGETHQGLGVTVACVQRLSPFRSSPTINPSGAGS